MPLSQTPGSGARSYDPPTRGQLLTTPRHDASTPTPTHASQSIRPSNSVQLTRPTTATSWSTSPGLQQPRPQSQTSDRGRGSGRGRTKSQSQSQGRDRGQSSSNSHGYSQPFTTHPRTANAATATSASTSRLNVYSGYTSVPRSPPARGDVSNASTSPVPSLSSEYPPPTGDYRLDSQFAQDMETDDGSGPGPRTSSVSGGNENQHRQESFLGVPPPPAHRRLELQGDPIGESGRDSQWAEPENSESILLGQPSSYMAFGNEIILAISMKGKALGGAYYDGQSSKLLVMEDTPDCNAVDMIETIKNQVRPTLILTGVRLEEYVQDALKWNEDGSENKLEVRPSGEFSYQLAKTKLLSIVMHFKHSGIDSSSSSRPGSSIAPQTTSGMDDSAQRDAQLQLSNLIDLESTESVGCAGAVISFLSRHGIAHRSTRDGRSTMAISVEAFTLYARERTESHPSMHSSIRGRKEGLSLFGLLNQTKTSQGRHLLKQWLLRPSLDMATIHERHQSVECFVRTENQSAINQLVECLSHIKNVPKVLQAMSKKATINDWQSILQFTYYCVKILNVSQEILIGNSLIIQEIRRQFVVEDLMTMGTYINDVLDFDESVIEGRCVVKRNVDEELDHMRQTYHGLDSFLSEIAKEISVTIPSDFTSIINVIYFPQLGYLITVPRNPEWKSEDDYQLEGFTVQFGTESTIYYKNAAMRELDEHLGDIHGLIVDREIDILQVLQERIIENSELLVTCSDLCAELDVLVSLARVARLRNYRRPTMVEGTILEIVNGRHPLQELVVDSFVRNSTLVGCEEQGTRTGPNTTTGKTTESNSSDTGDTRCESRVMILTGPNSSGKSVYLKQVALITFMAHVGSFVPADSAIIGITDKILTRLQTRETVSSIESSFMTDLQQVASAIRMATARSLVVLDEFGKGTTSTDGAGLFCGVVEHFAAMQEGRPKVLATTHFHELFENDLMDLSLPISLYTMEVYQNPDCMEATFFFRVVPGKAPSSLGPACAAMASMPAHIVQRGVYLSKLFRRYENVVPQLTPHEKEMQKLYERLTEMLLKMDLEDEHCLDFWDRDKTTFAATAFDDADDDESMEAIVKVDGPSGISLGKRKHGGGSSRKDEGENEGEESATECDTSGIKDSELDIAMRVQLHEFLALAKEIGIKERAEI
ncbi:MutS protein msh5 [Linnemannia exigua]|uniref:DNA mismatch repair protein MSH5 n=1 Tax=Linnemannia exigua TaxID=604196 RepID=A0AAD4DCZ2_9FUNG|nr:MutS protein msh5 [Linnemannia exigua]